MARDVPTIQVITSPEIKHTEQDTPDWVPAVGLGQIARAYARIIAEGDPDLLLTYRRLVTEHALQNPAIEIVRGWGADEPRQRRSHIHGSNLIVRHPGLNRPSEKDQGDVAVVVIGSAVAGSASARTNNIRFVTHVDTGLPSRAGTCQRQWDTLRD